MAHSIQVYKGRAEVINDLDLLVLLRFMLDEIEADSEHALKQPGDAWRKCVSQYAPGIIDLNLDAHFCDDAERAEFLALASRVKSKLERVGPSIHASCLNTPETPKGMVFGDFPTEFALQALERISNLLGR
jgi:hypothetical protein